MFIIYLLFVITKSHAEDSVDNLDILVEEFFPHHPFDCNPAGESYETEFTFLQGLARGFVHAEPHRIFFEYYFPAQHWVAFSTADQSIKGEKDECSACYFDNYYPLPPNKNHSNLYPGCIEECVDKTIFVGTVNSDETNINNWNIIEFQIIAQTSKKYHKKMYRIPKKEEILEIWGSEFFPYRENAHFESDIYTIGHGEDAKEYVHAKFWRKYDFSPESDLDEYDESNEWKPFVVGPYANSLNLTYPDSLCFISIASFYEGEYPYAEDALDGMLPGFYIDTHHLSNVHCYKRDDIKVDCGQDWSFLTQTGDTMTTQVTQPVIDVTIGADTSTTTTTTTKTSSKTSSTTSTTSTTSSTSAAYSSSSSSTSTSTTPKHGEDCCSAISGISYDDIDCLNISKSNSYIQYLESEWKKQECGRNDKLPTDLSVAIKNVNDAKEKDNCHYLWAHFNQIHELCYKYTFTNKKMKIYNHFKRLGGYECFNKNTNECEVKEDESFNNFDYDSSEDENEDEDVNYNDLLNDKSKSKNKTAVDEKKMKKESELAEMEEDGGLTITSLGILGLIIFLLTVYILYWFCCSNSSKGYRQSSQFMNHGYYDDDIDTDDYIKRNKYQQQQQHKYYNERINGAITHKYEDDGSNDGDSNDSDWSEDEQLGVINDDHNQMEIGNKKYSNKKKKNKKSKKNKSKNKHEKDYGYDISVNDVDSMPINSDNINDAVEVTVDNQHNGDEEEDNEYFVLQQETAPNDDKPHGD